MSFSSLTFIFAFLPITWLLHYFIRIPLWQNILLVITSLLFYAWSEPLYVVLLVLSILWNYASALNIAKCENHTRRRTELIIAIVVNLFILGFFKYANFLIGILNSVFLSLPEIEAGLPIGLSFFTFSALSYLVDVYKEKTPAQKNLLYLALYISFFGKLTMGPIVQYADCQNQLKARRTTKADLGAGVALFLKGLIKKVVIADQLAVVFSALQGNDTIIGAWTLAIAYTLQLYFDFSGYSDMAIGVSRLFGFHFKKNFDHPYLALNAQDFWRRWHISLSTWFRDYLYIPLGGNRVSSARWCVNLLIVWAATGLWHGANWTFIVWGLYYGVILMCEKFFLRAALEKTPKAIQHIYALVVIVIGWVLFMSPDITSAIHTLGYMLGIGASALADSSTLFYLKSYGFIFILGIIFSTNVYMRIKKFNVETFRNKAGIVRVCVYVVMTLICVSFMMSNTVQAFLYAAF